MILSHQVWSSKQIIFNTSFRRFFLYIENGRSSHHEIKNVFYKLTKNLNIFLLRLLTWADVV